MTESLPLSLPDSTETPRPLTHACTGQRSNVPAAVTSTVVPRWAPAGKREVTAGGAGKEEELTTEAQRHREDRKIILPVFSVSLCLCGPSFFTPSTPGSASGC